MSWNPFIKCFKDCSYEMLRLVAMNEQWQRDTLSEIPEVLNVLWTPYSCNFLCQIPSRPWTWWRFLTIVTFEALRRQTLPRYGKLSTRPLFGNKLKTPGLHITGWWLCNGFRVTVALTNEDEVFYQFLNINKIWCFLFHNKEIV
jgi:hypothetical protein